MFDNEIKLFENFFKINFAEKKSCELKIKI